jgi:hypothetical protein
MDGWMDLHLPQSGRPAGGAKTRHDGDGSATAQLRGRGGGTGRTGEQQFTWEAGSGSTRVGLGCAVVPGSARRERRGAPTIAGSGRAGRRGEATDQWIRGGGGGGRKGGGGAESERGRRSHLEQSGERK